MAKASYDFNSYLLEARPTDFVLKVSEEQSITIPPPTAEILMRLDEVTTARHMLQLICGKSWPEIYELFKDKHAEAMTALVKDIRLHFNLQRDPPGGG